MIGLVIALPAEARSIGVRGLHIGDCARWRHGWAALAGVGPHNAMRAAERLLACGVTSIANWGVAGALDGALAAGDVLIPDRIRYAPDDPGFTTHAAANAWLASLLSSELHVHRGALWSSPHPITTPADKRDLAAASRAVAVDMEAAPVAAVAARAKLPFVALKVICDPLTRELPASLAQALDGFDGRLSWSMLTAIALGGPASWRAARGLAQDFAHARHSLAVAARLAA